MSSYIFSNCPKCGTKNRASVENSGKTGRCGQCGAELRFIASPVDVNDASFNSEVMESAMPVLVDFWSPSCGHCIRMNPVLEEIAREHPSTIRIAKLDVSKNSRIPGYYEIRGTPAFLLFMGGREAGRFVGAMPKDELVRQIRTHVAI